MNRKRIERINRIEEEIEALSEALKREQRRGSREERLVMGTPLAILTGALIAVVLMALSSAITFGV